MDCVVGLDVGGTKILGGLVSTSGEVLHQRRSATCAPDASGKGDPRLGATTALLAELVTAAAKHGDRLLGVGAGFPEYVDQGLLTSHEVIDWDQQPARVIGGILADLGRPTLPVAVESDVRAGARAEAWIGAGAGHRSMLYCSWGTGISSTFVIDGRCWEGRRGEAIGMGEFHTPTHAASRLESFASGRAMAARMREIGAADFRGGVRQLDDLAADGDVDAKAVLESAGRAVACALDDLVAALDPHVILLGGGVGATEQLASRTARQLLDGLLGRRPNAPAVVPAALGVESGLVGAAYAVLSTL